MSEYIRASDGNGEAVRAVVVVNRDVGDMLLNVDSVLNWPHKGIATSGDVGSDGIMDEETVTVFYYTLSGSMIHIDGFAPGYYDRGHTVGQMVLIKPTTPWADAVAEAAENLSGNFTRLYDIEGSIYYLGGAPVGSSTSQPVWSIRKIDWTTSPYTSKIALNVSWDDRVGAIYE